MSRSKKYITKEAAIDNYWSKHQATLSKTFTKGEWQFKTYMKENLDHSKYLGKKAANQAIKDEIDRIKYGSDYVENRQTLREYAEINDIKGSKFNNKKFINKNVDLHYYGSTPWGATGDVTIDQMVEISNSDLVILKGTIVLDSGSPVDYKEVVPRSLLNV